MYLITNGRIVTETGILENHDLFVDNSRIAAIAERGSNGTGQTAADSHKQRRSGEGTATTDCETIDVGGAYVVPGFIDIHADYIEHMAAPRPTSLMPFDLSLREAERELIAHGITTMFHSLAIFKYSEFGINPIRTPENVIKFANLIAATHGKKHLIRHRFHARFEIDYMEQVDALESFISENKVHLVSFMDHSPGQGQYRNLELFKKTLKGYGEMNDTQFEEVLKRHANKEKMTLDRIGELIALASERNIAVASHDDDSIDKISLVKSFGTRISEFPITIEVARAAKAAGLMTVAGAPNVLLGGSHSGNLNAAEAIRDGCIDILCSDYYPASLLHAVFRLHREYGIALPFLFRLVSTNPAKAVNMDAEFGSLTVGKRADLAIIDFIEDGFPVITGVMVDGELVSQTHYRT